MKRTYLIILGAVIFLFGFSLPIDRVSGKWSGTIKKNDSTAFPLTYNFNLIGDSVAGTVQSQLGNFPIQQGKLDSAGLHFIVSVNGLDVYHQGAVYPDSIGMSISINGAVAHCKLSRSN